MSLLSQREIEADKIIYNITLKQSVSPSFKDIIECAMKTMNIDEFILKDWAAFSKGVNRLNIWVKNGKWNVGLNYTVSRKNKNTFSIVFYSQYGRTGLGRAIIYT